MRYKHLPWTFAAWAAFGTMSGWSGDLKAADPSLRLGPAEQSGPALQPASLPKTVTFPAAGSPEVVWHDHFAMHNEPPAAVRDAVRKLFDSQKFDHAIALMQAALRHGQGQPWMHEVLGLAMQANGSSAEEIERTLLSAIDIQQVDAVSLIYVAKYLDKAGSSKRALELYRQASQLAPTRPEPYVLALQTAQRLQDVEGLRWASLGILSQAWNKDDSDLTERAQRVAQSLIHELRKQGRTQEAVEFETAVKAAAQRDVLVVVSWTGEADVDLLVEEPSGTICSHRQDRTTSGGVLLDDAFSQNAQRSNKLVSETYVCPEGFSGKYRLRLRRVWGQVTANRVTVDVYTHWGTPKAKHERREIALRDDDSMVVFGLDNGRRQDLLADHLVANAAQQQQAVRHDILMQQIGTQNPLIPDPTRPFARPNNPYFPFPQSAVGFQPVIIVLSEGATLSAQAVISADRRYVRFTGVPMFTGIGDVTTFNIGSGASTTAAFMGGGNGANQLGGGGGAGNP